MRYELTLFEENYVFDGRICIRRAAQHQEKQLDPSSLGIGLGVRKTM
jgi:hypothetical protein